MTRVLLSSDDAGLVSELSEQARGCGVQLIPTGPQAVLELARSVSPDLVILDASPKVDSRLLLARLKQDLRTCGLRIAMLSATKDENLARFSRELRALHVQTKPLPVDYLQTLVHVRASTGWVALRSA